MPLTEIQIILRHKAHLSCAPHPHAVCICLSGIVLVADGHVALEIVVSMALHVMLEGSRLTRPHNQGVAIDSKRRSLSTQHKKHPEGKEDKPRISNG